MFCPCCSRFALVLALLGIGLLTAAPGPAADDKAGEGWVKLFNGKDLEGWEQHGGKAQYRVEGDAIVGSTVPNTPNSFLCTKKQYGDFLLELDFKVHDKLNSGVQIRSEVSPEPTTAEINGKTYKFAADRVHGYQVEIDPAERAWTGGIYDEGRRGWLVDLKSNEAARKAFKHNEWNHFKIECKGDSIKTWLNDVPAAELKDNVTPRGLIALQVHGTKSKEPLEVRWKEIRIKELK